MGLLIPPPATCLFPWHLLIKEGLAKGKGGLSSFLSWVEPQWSQRLFG